MAALWPARPQTAPPRRAPEPQMRRLAMSVSMPQRPACGVGGPGPLEVAVEDVAAGHADGFFDVVRRFGLDAEVAVGVAGDAVLQGSARYESRPASTRGVAWSRADRCRRQINGRGSGRRRRSGCGGRRQSTRGEDGRVGEGVAVDLRRRYVGERPAAAAGTRSRAGCSPRRCGRCRRRPGWGRPRCFSAGSRDSRRLILSCEPSGLAAADWPRSVARVAGATLART